MINEIKRKYVDWRVSNETKRSVSDKQYVCWDDVETVQVIMECDSYNEDEVKTIKERMKEKNVRIWCYVRSKDVFVQMIEGVILFNPSSVNLFGVPKGDFVKVFSNARRDVLIDLSTKEEFPLRYLLQISKTSCKCGVKKENYPFYDFEIESEKTMKPIELLDVILTYLKMIKGKKINKNLSVSK